MQKQQELDRPENGLEIFPRFVDDLVKTARGDPEVVFEAANKLQPNLQFP